MASAWLASTLAVVGILIISAYISVTYTLRGNGMCAGIDTANRLRAAVSAAPVISFHRATKADYGGAVAAGGERWNFVSLSCVERRGARG